jgi:hypothetical protein
MLPTIHPQPGLQMYVLLLSSAAELASLGHRLNDCNAILSSHTGRAGMAAWLCGLSYPADAAAGTTAVANINEARATEL